MIIPSIDLMSGKAVQLIQGRTKVLELDNVMELANRFKIFGEIAVIDLDAALGTGRNTELVKELCKIAECRVGGGIRTIEKAKELLRAGAKKLIIGTQANREFLSQLPKDKLIVALDTKNSCVVSKGWKEKTGKKPLELALELQDYCSGFLYTDVDREGTMQGLDINRVMELKKGLNATSSKLTVAGGISSIDEIKLLEDNGIDSQLGMALYTGKIKPEDAFIELVDFKKNKGLVPTIAQDDRGQVLMLAYSTKESLRQALESRKGVYYSRSKKAVWIKGATSGNFQELLKARPDCDRDALIFTVKQKNVACHEGQYSCFGNRTFSLQQLYETIQDRIKNPREGSYTAEIAASEKNILRKIDEEVRELLDYSTRDNLIWEMADVIYFMLVLMGKKGIGLNEVMSELESRRR